MLRPIAALLLLSIVIAAWGGTLAFAQTVPSVVPGRGGIGDIRNWGYQLQRADPERVAASPFDLVVVDYSRDGTEAGRFSPADVERMKQVPGGGRRIILAYMSIGEAEDYRYYWGAGWVETVNVLRDPSSTPEERSRRTEQGASPVKVLRLPRLSAPSWLGRENEIWPGNFFVRYWEKDWQAIIAGAQDSYLARIVAVGFDGVFLDRIDTFQLVASMRPDARLEMVRLVREIAAKARALRPGFLVVPQNGEQLLSDPAYLAAIDAVAKEDLVYGEDGDGIRNSPAVTARGLRWLAPAVNRGIPVLVVEYVQDQKLAGQVRADIARFGFLPYLGVRALDRLVFPGETSDGEPGSPARAPGPATSAPLRKR